MKSYASNAKYLKEVAAGMRLLVVEDEEMIRMHLEFLLSPYFSDIVTAADGTEALMAYETETFDLIITDLNMPNMGGEELIQRIHANDPSQKIIVASGESEGERVIALVNMGIDGFILKPFDNEGILNVLIKTCQSIYDHKMLVYLSNLLEQNNEELARENHELAQTLGEIKKMHTSQKIFQESDNSARELSDEEKTMLYTRNTKISAAEFHTSYPFELDRTNEELEQLEDRFNYILLNSDRHDHGETHRQINGLLRDYAREIEIIPQFGALSYGITQLAETFESVADSEKLSSLLPMITSLLDNLEQWRRGVFYLRNVDDIHYMDNSLLSDALSLQGFFNRENSVASDDGLDLF